MTEFVVAECMIRQLYARYCDAVWRKDVDAFVDCFTENGEWRISGFDLRGRAQIGDFMTKVFTAYHRILLTPRVPILHLNEDGATAKTYLEEYSVVKTGQITRVIGQYYDRFAVEGDRWLISWRAFFTEYLGPIDLTGTFSSNPDYGPPPAMPPLDVVPADHSHGLSKVI